MKADFPVSEAKPAASVVFTVHNRREMLLRAIACIKGQSVPLEVVVIDDASTDGVEDAVKATHPEIQFVRVETSKGPCHARNLGIALCTTEIVFPLDDDSMVIHATTIEKALTYFQCPNVGIVAIPFQNILQSADLLQQFDPARVDNFFEFVACSHGVRKTAVLESGGYNEELFYMGEESDLAIRMFEKGWTVVIADAPEIQHMQPKDRRSYKADFYGRRNELLFVWQNAPLRYLFTDSLYRILRGAKFSLLTGRTRSAVHGYVSAVAGLFSGFKRNPVSRSTYDAFRQSANYERSRRIG